MKLSNFEWTDKETVKWFIMLPSGHEGPYSLKSLKTRLENKHLSADARVWSEGLSEAVPLKVALYNFEAALSKEVHRASEVVVPPPIPVPTQEILTSPPPVPDEEIPPLPPLPAPEKVKIQRKNNSSQIKIPIPLIAISLLIFFGYIGLGQWIKTKEGFSIRRYPRMSLELHERIHEEVLFDGWDKKIFFKEYVPIDLSSIWFVNSGFQTCDVEASFRSIKGKTLSLDESEVFFRSRSRLKDHVAEFTRFEFQNGQKVVPGLYEADIVAKNCEWDGLLPKLANNFSRPDAEYVTRVRMILFPQHPSEFNMALERLLQKKTVIETKGEKKNDLFWQDLDEKMQTLYAITMQVEQFFMDLLSKDARKFKVNLKSGIDEYTKQFGHTLTNFVISNEKDFKNMDQLELTQMAPGSDYEKVIRLTSKEIGFESMKIIERLQNLKNPKRAQLNGEKKKIVSAFESLKGKINQKLALISEQKEK